MQFGTHKREGVFGSPNNPGEFRIVIGHISIQTLVALYAKDGAGQFRTHYFDIL